jgi:hypothetical protein
MDLASPWRSLVHIRLQCGPNLDVLWKNNCVYGLQVFLTVQATPGYMPILRIQVFLPEPYNLGENTYLRANEGEDIFDVQRWILGHQALILRHVDTDWMCPFLLATLMIHICTNFWHITKSLFLEKIFLFSQPWSITFQALCAKRRKQKQWKWHISGTVHA